MFQNWQKKINGKKVWFGILGHKTTIMAQEALEKFLCSVSSSLDSSLGCQYSITTPFY